MRPAGQAEIDAAKADGRWDAAYAPASTIEVPPDLVEAMEAAGVTDVFAGLKSQDRYSILFQPPRRQAARDPRPAQIVKCSRGAPLDFEVSAPQALERAQRRRCPSPGRARR